MALEPGAEGRLALSGLRDVGLGSGSFHGPLGNGRARSGIRRAARHAKFLCRRPAASDRRTAKSRDARLDDMARRILTSMFAQGLCDKSDASEPADFATSDETALAIEREGARSLEEPGPAAALRRYAHARCHRSSCRPRRPFRRGLLAGRPARRNRDEGTGPERIERRSSIRRRRSKRSAGSFRAPKSTTTTASHSGAGGERRGRRRCGHRVRGSMDDGDRGRPGPQPARRTGPAGRSGRPRQSAHRGCAGNRRAGADALDRRDGGRARGLVPRPTGRRGDRRNPLRRRQPFGPPAGHLSGQRNQLPHPRIQGDPNGAPIGPAGRGGITAGPSPPTTTRAPRSATNGSSSAASGPCFRSASGFRTPNSPWTALRSASTAAR